MILRYDFGEKLDLSRFQRQSSQHIGRMRELIYNIFVKDYKIVIEINMPDDSTSHSVNILLFEIKRDNAGEIIKANSIYPHRDSRFQDITSIIDLFNIDSCSAHFVSNSVSQTVDRLLLLIKVIHKINGLKIFL